MSLAYLHGKGYLIPALLFLAALFIGIPTFIGMLYYWRRSRKRQSAQKQGLSLRD
jgi:cellulose synthase/poly-beta-1,6-N-acetylglucosamine synthase-like glycosyltransferase